VKRIIEIEPINPDTFPAWMTELEKKFTNTNTHINIRLFIAFVICENAAVFAKFADRFWFPFLQLLGEAKKFTQGITPVFEVFLSHPESLVYFKEHVSDPVVAPSKRRHQTG
jgi:hypothetical protein